MTLGGTPLVDHSTSRHGEQPRLGHLVAAPVGEQTRSVSERLRGGFLGSAARASPSEAEVVDPIEPVVEELVEAARERHRAIGRIERPHVVSEAVHDHTDDTGSSNLLPGDEFSCEPRPGSRQMWAGGDVMKHMNRRLAGSVVGPITSLGLVASMSACSNDVELQSVVAEGSAVSAPASSVDAGTTVPSPATTESQAEDALVELDGEIKGDGNPWRLSALGGVEFVVPAGHSVHHDGDMVLIRPSWEPDEGRYLPSAVIALVSQIGSTGEFPTVESLTSDAIAGVGSATRTGTRIEAGRYTLDKLATPAEVTVPDGWWVQGNFPGYVVLTGNESFGPGDRALTFRIGLDHIVAVSTDYEAAGELLRLSADAPSPTDPFPTLAVMRGAIVLNEAITCRFVGTAGVLSATALSLVTAHEPRAVWCGRLAQPPRIAGGQAE